MAFMSWSIKFSIRSGINHNSSINKGAHGNVEEYIHLKPNKDHAMEQCMKH